MVYEKYTRVGSDSERLSTFQNEKDSFTSVTETIAVETEIKQCTRSLHINAALEHV